MFSRFKNPLLKNSLIYVISDGISKSLSFLTLPIISFYLIPSELGIASNFDVLQSIVILIAGQAVVNSLPYFYYERTHKEVAILVSNLLLIIFTICIIMSGLIVAFTNIISEYLHIGICLQILTIVSVIANLLTNIDLTLYRLEDKPYIFLVFQILQTIIYLTLLFVLVVHKELGAIGKIYSSVITICFVSILHIILLCRRKYIVLGFSKNELLRLIRFGIPLLPHSLSFWIRSGMDKIFLTTFCGLSYNGLYSMGVTIGSIYTIFKNAFENAYTPYISKRITQTVLDNHEKQKLVKQNYLIAMCFLFLAIFMIGVSWILIEYILSERYQGSFYFIPSIIISSLIYAVYSLVIQFSYIRKKTKWIGIITFSGSCIQCLLSYILIKEYGPKGLNISMIIGALIIMIGTWGYSNRVFPLPWFRVFKLSKQ